MNFAASQNKTGKSLRARRLVILSATTGYQLHAFVEAATKLDLELVLGTDRCHVLDDPWRDGAIPLRFEQARESAQEIIDYARRNPIHAIVALGDRPTTTAAWACRALGLPYNSPEAAESCRDKYKSRQCLQSAQLKVPSFVRFPIGENPIHAAEGVNFPCVLKPLALSASQGVIRANNSEEFTQAFERIRALLESPDVQILREETSRFIQVEAFIDGKEIALEGLVDQGRLHVLALFDKPDPLDGPFFEETIYVTPSRLAGKIQSEAVGVVERAVRALGLSHGPVHAELRVNPKGIWILEVAARSIGGLCSRALRFAGSMTLEELLIRQALKMEVKEIVREPAASGVMMIPIPRAGLYENVEGVEEARQVPGVEEIRITVKPQQKLVPLPEGSTYLGFIFARADRPEQVERALRQAHQKLRLTIAPVLPVVEKRSPSPTLSPTGGEDQR
jgi:biotin carboxylase